MYPGNPLDPPLRSRFQCRDIAAPPLESKLLMMRKFLSSPEFAARTAQDRSAILYAAEALATFSEAMQQFAVDDGTVLCISPTGTLPLFATVLIRTDLAPNHLRELGIGNHSGAALCREPHPSSGCARVQVPCHQSAQTDQAHLSV
jgi:hypothetical protein